MHIHLLWKYKFNLMRAHYHESLKGQPVSICFSGMLTSLAK